jgi:hypothetical protein
MAMQDYLDDRGLDLALAARRAEGDADLASGMAADIAADTTERTI